MPAAVPRETCTINQAAELTGVSRRTIYHWIRAGKVEYVRTAGGSIRIFTETLWRGAEPPVAASVESPAGE